MKRMQRVVNSAELAEDQTHVRSQRRRKREGIRPLTIPQVVAKLLIVPGVTGLSSRERQ